MSYSVVDYRRVAVALGATGSPCEAPADGQSCCNTGASTDAGALTSGWSSGQTAESSALQSARANCVGAGGSISSRAEGGMAVFYCCCPGSMVWNGGTCSCPAGWITDPATGQCTQLVTGGQTGPVALHVCPADQAWSESANACVSAACPEGTVWSASDGKCVVAGMPDQPSATTVTTTPITVSGQAPRSSAYTLPTRQVASPSPPPTGPTVVEASTFVTLGNKYWPLAVGAAVGVGLLVFFSRRAA